MKRLLSLISLAVTVLISSGCKSTSTSTISAGENPQVSAASPVIQAFWFIVESKVPVTAKAFLLKTSDRSIKTYGPQEMPAKSRWLCDGLVDGVASCRLIIANRIDGWFASIPEKNYRITELVKNPFEVAQFTSFTSKSPMVFKKRYDSNPENFTQVTIPEGTDLLCPAVSETSLKCVPLLGAFLHNDTSAEVEVDDPRIRLNLRQHDIRFHSAPK